MKSWTDRIDTPPRDWPRAPIDTHRRAWRSNRISNIGTVLLLFLILCIAFEPLLIKLLDPWVQNTQPDDSSGPFQWSSIEAEETLVFHRCYDEYECAKLKLPLDYFNGTHPDSTISLALLKIPAKVSVDDPRYGGPVLVNPGGPGGPGVFFTLAAGKSIQTIIDSAEDPDSLQGWQEKHSTAAKYFDIIGFDPRGVGQTKPAATCMPDGAAWWSWNLRVSTQGILGSSDAALGRLWSMYHAYGASCKQSMDTENEPDIKRYMTTASVARDMLEVVEKHSDYVAKAKSSKCTRPVSRTSAADPPKLQYWGFSYGTILGATFASMFPDRVGRLTLDGVVNTDDYKANLGFGSLHDTEKVMTWFYAHCLQLGPAACPLAHGAASIEDIEYRVQKIIQSLYHNPLPLNSIEGPEVLDYTEIKYLLFVYLYVPSRLFSPVAEVLLAIEQGGGAVLDQYALGLQMGHIYHCPINGSTYDMDVPQQAILCSDGVDTSSDSIETFERYWHQLAELSPTAGSIWARLRLQCISWKIRAVHRFKGAYGGKTSHPILWISNTADPVTPLKSGRIMHNRFPGSALLVQDSAGHCSLAQPTPCTLKYIRSYFQHGELPPPNTLCIPAQSPFSLNSTDQNSPFYDPSLDMDELILDSDVIPHRATSGNAVERTKEAEEWIIAQRDQDTLVHAAKHLQNWLLEKHSFFPAHGHNKRLNALVALSRTRELNT